MATEWRRAWDLGDDWELMFAVDLLQWTIGAKWQFWHNFRCLSIYLPCIDIHLSQWTIHAAAAGEQNG